MATTTYGSPYVSGSDLVAGWPAASLTVADAIDAAGYYVGRGINTQTASYTGVLTDAGKTVTMSNAGATTVTIPPNSSVAYPTGTRINILNLGAGACTPTAGAGVTISGTISALATNQGAAVVKTATNTWSYLPFTSGTPVLTSADVSSTTGSPTITTSGGFTIYSFTGSGSITTSRSGLLDALAVGAGAAGGKFASSNSGYGMGGGGAGSINYQTNFYLAAGSYTVTISSGAAHNTKMAGVASLGSVLIAPGGGAGGTAGGSDSFSQGLNGGCGGGGRNGTGNYGGLGIVGFGSNGGAGQLDELTTSGGGGGGGSSAAGSAGTTLVGGAGGAGTANSITGSSVTYGGGGGGGRKTSGAGAGGAGGGGAGGATTGTNGTANLGGGGGGGSDTGAPGTGGSGVLIIKVVT